MPHSWGCSEEQCDCLEPKEDPPRRLEPPPEALEADSTHTRFDFRMLPAELRLRVLRLTHLGPPETGDYAQHFDKMLIRDGRLDNDFNVNDQSSMPCSYCSRRGHAAPPRAGLSCQCRILPMALFLVDWQMYREASEIFYSHALLDFYGDDFGVALAVLRRIPADSLRRLRRMQFTMTVAQCDGWGAGALACGYPESSFHHMARCYWNDGPRPEFDYQAGWRAVLSFLAENTDLPRMSITVDMGTCGWAFIDITDMLMWDDLDFGWFRFIYDFYIGVVTAMCTLKTLGAVHFDLYPFKRLVPWLEREVIGCRQGDGDLEQQPGRQGYGNHIPSWHNLDQRLEGSNYVPNS